MRIDCKSLPKKKKVELPMLYTLYLSLYTITNTEYFGGADSYARWLPTWMARGVREFESCCYWIFRLLDTRCFLKITVQPWRGGVDVRPGNRGVTPGLNPGHSSALNVPKLFGSLYEGPPSVCADDTPGYRDRTSMLLTVPPVEVLAGKNPALPRVFCWWALGYYNRVARGLWRFPPR